LLEFRRQAGDLGEPRGQIGPQTHARVAGASGRKFGHLGHQIVEIDGFDQRVALAGEIQELMGDVPAAGPLDPDLVQGPAHFGQIGGACLVVPGQDVQDPAGFLGHDGHGIVDLVGDIGGQLAYGGHLAGLDDLLV